MQRLTRTSRSFKVSNWDILEFRSQFEIRTFISLNTLDYRTLIDEYHVLIFYNWDILELRSQKIEIRPFNYQICSLDYGNLKIC